MSWTRTRAVPGTNSKLVGRLVPEPEGRSRCVELGVPEAEVELTQLMPKPEPTLGPPGPTLVLISTSSNLPRNSIFYKITRQVPREAQPYSSQPASLRTSLSACGSPPVGRLAHRGKRD